MSPDSPSQEEQDAMAAEWAAALAEAAPAPSSVASEVTEAPEQVSTPSFANFSPTTAGGPAGDINMILDIPVQLTVELGRTRIPIKNILQLAQGSVVELDALATQGPLSLGALADTLDARAGTVIITEGLLNYFDEAHVRQMWRQFAAVLGRFAQGRYYSDLHLANTHHRGAMLRGFTTLLSVFVRGRVHLHFRDSTQACAALREAGFRSAVLHEPREFAAALPFALGPGANLVRIIEARCGREDSPVGRYNHSE